ncbi:MAG: GGDEF domain-containing protein [Bacillota bacterium]
MLRRHPLSALIYVWGLDLVALSIVLPSLSSLSETTAAQWLQFGLWTAVLVVAQLKLIHFAGLMVSLGWQMAVDFTAAMVLPFPLFCLALLVRWAVMVVRRCWQRHPEWWLGPDFNAANVVLNAWLAHLSFRHLGIWLGDSDLAQAVVLMLTALVFVGSQNVLLTTLLALDQRKPWTKVGSLDSDTLIGDGIMVMAGALLTTVYLSNPFLMLMALPIVLFLHKTLERVNQAKLAYIDGKTGIYNYRYFDEALTEAFRKASTNRRPLALIFGDMDHLRDINNTHGHMVGDQAIAAVAHLFKANSGACGTACRFGGEEFVLMLPGSTRAEAAQVAEQIRRGVAAARVPLEGGGSLGLSISLGVAAYPEDASSIESLVKAADEAVYKAKHSGRNRVCVHEERKPLALHS